MRRQVNPKTAADALRRASRLRPRLAIVLGSGFQSITQAMTVARAVPYAKLAGFPKPTVTGHTGQALIGTLSSTEILVLSGRAHYYEGHSLETVTFPIRVLAEYGIENILLTNAAGGINKKFRAGEFMQFTDHLNFIGDNPLRGLHVTLAQGRERFIDLSQTYDTALNKALQA
ncbi:MAG: purine-nucleoside phosphorylase, partial [Verrucomicrobiota bacterium]|nr:purine-nucleoside phosphorylase [Verrucomicrobiota bacterium]